MSRVFIIDPLAPLVFRSGKPFDALSGGEADGANFPPPSSLAGLARTRYAEQTNLNFAAPGTLDRLLKISVAGPLLARRELADGRLTPLAPKPADALYKKGGAATRVTRLSPQKASENGGCDLPAGLRPVMSEEESSAKPAPGPAFWPWACLAAWGDGQEVDFNDLGKDDYPETERRFHTALDAKTGAAAAGRLFQTEGLDFSPRRRANAGDRAGPWAERELVLLGRSEEDLAEGLVVFGGERRLSRLRPAPAEIWPGPPNGLGEALRRAGGLRLTLITPALFSQGWHPGWLNGHLDGQLTGEPPDCPGLKLQLQAAAVERWLPISGWDLAGRKPKAARRLAPAGSVYWFKILEPRADADQAAALWLRPISDQDQDNRDGFGLALPAPWTPFQ